MAVAAALGAGATPSEPGGNALLRASMVAAPLGAGLYAWFTRQHVRFARLMLVIGLTAFATTLAESSDPTLYTAGRAAGWVMEALLVTALLSFPSGRITAVRDRRLVQAMCATVAFAYLPTLVLAGELKVPSPYTSCTQDCPQSVLMAFAHQPGFVGPVFFGLGSVLVFAVMLAVLVRLQRHIADASSLQRQVLVPLLAVGMVRATAVGVAIVAREVDAGSVLAADGAILIAWCTVALPIAFLLGLLRLRLSCDRALRDLTTCARGLPDVATLQRAFAETLGDDRLRIVVASDAAAPPCAGRRRLPVADHRGEAVAAIDCDATLAADCPQLVEAAGTIAAVALDNLQLSEQADASAREVRRSRARISAAADRERRRIERDLHDGAQQRLVAIRIELGLAEDQARTDPPACIARIQALEIAMDDALDDLRSLAHGICPPLLAGQGLQEALLAATARSSVPASLQVHGLVRYSPEVESAVYFCVLEALQNVDKHAFEARGVVVMLTAGSDDQLRFSVCDDGTSADRDREPAGAGITNMRDRVAAIGGELSVMSRRGIGTEVRGNVPLHPNIMKNGQELRS